MVRRPGPESDRASGASRTREDLRDGQDGQDGQSRRPPARSSTPGARRPRPVPAPRPGRPGGHGNGARTGPASYPGPGRARPACVCRRPRPSAAHRTRPARDAGLPSVPVAVGRAGKGPPDPDHPFPTPLRWDRYGYRGGIGEPQRNVVLEGLTPEESPGPGHCGGSPSLTPTHVGASPVTPCPYTRVLSGDCHRHRKNSRYRRFLLPLSRPPWTESGSPRGRESRVGRGGFLGL